MSHRELTHAIDGISDHDNASLSIVEEEREIYRQADQHFPAVGDANSHQLNAPQNKELYVEDDRSTHGLVVGGGEDQQSHKSRPLAFTPHIYELEEDSIAIEAPIDGTSPIPPRYGGRLTPVARRYKSELSSDEDHSYLTDADGHARSHHTVQSYVAVNPFTPSVAQSLVNIGVHSNVTTIRSQGYPRPPTPIPQSYSTTAGHWASTSTSRYILAFCFDTIPRQMYLYLHLRLPSLYFSRVARIFEDAEISMPDIKRMALASANDWKRDSTNMVHKHWNFEPSVICPAFSSLKSSWEGFINSLLNEWRTLNIVSVLLLS
jgi:hypothetical protein